MFIVKRLFGLTPPKEPKLDEQDEHHTKDEVSVDGEQSDPSDDSARNTRIDQQTTLRAHIIPGPRYCDVSLSPLGEEGVRGDNRSCNCHLQCNSNQNSTEVFIRDSTPNLIEHVIRDENSVDNKENWQSNRQFAHRRRARTQHVQHRHNGRAKNKASKRRCTSHRHLR